MSDCCPEGNMKPTKAGQCCYILHPTQEQTAVATRYSWQCDVGIPIQLRLRRSTGHTIACHLWRVYSSARAPSNGRLPTEQL
jgi:hypothetical protein